MTSFMCTLEKLQDLKMATYHGQNMLSVTTWNNARSIRKWFGLTSFASFIIFRL